MNKNTKNIKFILGKRRVAKKSYHMSVCLPTRRVRNGFSFVEAIIAVFIFAMLAVMLSGIFSVLLKNYVSAKKTQKSAESAQYIMNLMAKTIRSGTLSSSASYNGDPEIMMFDNSRSLCVIYKYEDEVLKVATNAGADINACESSPPSSFSPLTAVGEISDVSFYGTPSVSGNIGKVSILAKVFGGDAAQIQTTVSLRQ